MKKIKRIPGQIAKVPLIEGYHSYCRILKFTSYAFYNVKTKEEISDLKKVISLPVLFITSVNSYAITEGIWTVIGKLPLEKQFHTLPPRYIQDPIQTNKFWIVYEDGIQQESNYEECKNLERESVWQPHLIEKRLNNYFFPSSETSNPINSYKKRTITTPDRLNKLLTLCKPSDLQ